MLSVCLCLCVSGLHQQSNQNENENRNYRNHEILYTPQYLHPIYELHDLNSHLQVFQDALGGT